MNIVAIIQARMGSSRLPGKVLLPTRGRPMLIHMIERLRQCWTLDEIIVATPAEDDDGPIAKALWTYEAFSGLTPQFRWDDENDVLSRVLYAAHTHHADVIVELTADCPIIDPRIVDRAVITYMQGDIDYVSNTAVRVYPDGMDVAVFNLATLERCSREAQDPYDREHVTTYIQRHPELFKLHHLTAPPDLFWPELGLTLDEPADYELLRRIIEHFYPADDYSLGDILHLLRDEHPEWLELNRDIQRAAVR